MITKREKIVCRNCGKKFKDTKKNYSVYCKSCRGSSLRDVARMRLIDEVTNEETEYD